MGPVVTRLFAARQKQKTVKEESVPYDEDLIEHDPPETEDEMNHLKGWALRQQLARARGAPNPKRPI